VLTPLVSMHGAPRYLQSDNRPELVACAILRWLHEAGIETALIDPGKPWPNGADESFNGCAATLTARGASPAAFVWKWVDCSRRAGQG
jgi:hypothetical protein